MNTVRRGLLFWRDILQCQMEPENIVGKYAVAVIKKNKVVEHLMNDKSGKFVKTVFFT